MVRKKVAKQRTADELLEQIVLAIQEKKGKKIVALHIGTLPNAVCEYFVICSADSTTQVGAIADNVEAKMLEQFSEKAMNSAGFENALWIVLDYVDIVVHVFQSEQRDFYKLEELWADATSKTFASDD